LPKDKRELDITLPSKQCEQRARKIVFCLQVG
jgi:hypothetical protein